MYSESHPQSSEYSHTPSRYPIRNRTKKTSYQQPISLEKYDFKSKSKKRNYKTPSKTKDTEKIQASTNRIYQRTIQSNDQKYYEIKKQGQESKIISRTTTTKFTLQSANSFMNIGNYTFNRMDPTLKIGEFELVQKQKQYSTCKCIKTDCSKNNCSCVKNGDHCHPERCLCSQQCLNQKPQRKKIMKQQIKESSQQYIQCQIATQKLQIMKQQVSEKVDSTQKSCHCSKNKCATRYCPCLKSGFECISECTCKKCKNRTQDVKKPL